MLFFPVHQEQHAHWCLVTADIPNEQIISYDSLNKENLTCLQILKSHLQELSGRLQFSVMQAENIPLQLNSYDCVVFVCLYSHCLAERSAFKQILLHLETIWF